MELGSELKAAVWAAAWSAFGKSLDDELMGALALSRRRPGFDDMLRLHARAAGPGLDILATVLSRHCRLGVYQLQRDFIEMRYQLRWHIVRHLQARLISDGQASSAIRDDFIAVDLGL